MNINEIPLTCQSIQIAFFLIIRSPSIQYNSFKTVVSDGCFNPILGQIWTNPAIGLHYITFLTLCLSLPIFEPKLG